MGVCYIMIGGSTISKREANKFCDHVPPTIISNYDHLPTLTNFTNTKVNHSKPVFAGRGGFPLFNHHLWWYRDVVMSFQITQVSNYTYCPWMALQAPFDPMEKWNILNILHGVNDVGSGISRKNDSSVLSLNNRHLYICGSVTSSKTSRKPFHGWS